MQRIHSGSPILHSQAHLFPKILSFESRLSFEIRPAKNVSSPLLNSVRGNLVSVELSGRMKIYFSLFSSNVQHWKHSAMAMFNNAHSMITHFWRKIRSIEIEAQRKDTDNDNCVFQIISLTNCPHPEYLKFGTVGNGK